MERRDISQDYMIRGRVRDLIFIIEKQNFSKNRISLIIIDFSPDLWDYMERGRPIGPHISTFNSSIKKMAKNIFF